MDNVTVNASFEDNLATRIGIGAADGVLLLILFIVTVYNLLLVAALFAVNSEFELVRSIRVILINILVACVVGELGSAMYHISALLLLSGGSISRLPLCHAITYLDVTSSSGRVLFAVYYALTVFIVVRWWNKPVLAPRNTKYFIIGAVFVWFLAIVAVVPAAKYQEFSKFCEDQGSPNNSQDIDFRLTLYVSLPYFFLSAIPVIVTPILLIIISCYIKRNSIGEHRDTKKALVKFGFFLLILQGINAIAQIVAPLLLVIGISSLSNSFFATFLAVAVSDLSRIPTNLLIITFFKPVQDKLKKWICGCVCCPCFGKQIAGKYTAAENGANTAHVQATNSMGSMP